MGWRASPRAYLLPPVGPALAWRWELQMSSYLIAAPDVMAAAAQELTAIGSAVKAANAAAAGSTTSLAVARPG